MTEATVSNTGCGPYEEWGVHEYAEIVCPQCGTEHCYGCSRSNMSEGPPPERAFIECPRCGRNNYDQR